VLAWVRLGLSRSYKVVCLIDSGVEVLIVGEKLSEVDYILVEKSTSDDRSVLFSVS